MRIGSLFSGYGGLDLGVQSVLGGDVAWHCDFDTGPSKVLAHHWPDVPNLHDVTAVDWTAVEPVDVITGGSPCQDVSAAGKRAGMRAGTRSGLWASMCDAVDIIRPSLVVWENVRGAYSAAADSNVEPCPVCVGEGEQVHLRALGRVLGDLAELGYDAWWTGVRAADAGAPHSRFRVFVFAWPAADTFGGGRDGRTCTPRRQPVVGASPAGSGDVVAADAPGDRRERSRSARRRRPRPANDDRAASHTGRDARPEDDQDGTAATRGGRDAAAHPGGVGPVRQSAVDGREGAVQQRHVDGRLLEAGGLDGGLAGSTGPDPAPHADGLGQKGLWGLQRSERDPHGRSRAEVTWGDYEPAIRRWEHTTGRPAPAPTEPGKTGQPRLAPAFVEWLMGLPDGHVTAVPGLTRNEQLKLLGNGVVPQQAALATRQWLTWRDRQAAA